MTQDDELFEQQMKNLREARRIVRLRDRPDRDDIIETLEWAESRLKHERDALRAAPTPAPPADLVALVLKWQKVERDYYADLAGDFSPCHEARMALLAWTSDALSSPVGETPALRAAIREPAACDGGVAVRWCPRCGTCSCKATQIGEEEWDADAACPIHGSRATHVAVGVPAAMLEEAPYCEQHGTMVPNDEMGRSWRCAVDCPNKWPVDPAAMPPGIQVGDILRTERGRTVHVDRILTRPADMDASVWQGGDHEYIDEGTGGQVLDVAVVAVYQPIWRRTDGKEPTA